VPHLIRVRPAPTMVFTALLVAAAGGSALAVRRAADGVVEDFRLACGVPTR
jgi:hypothetical protein